MFNILNLENPDPLTNQSFINYKNIDVSSIAGSGNVANEIKALDFSMSGKFILAGG
jgi:hypothetical protein